MQIFLITIYSLLPAAVSLVAINLEIFPFVTYPAGKALMLGLPIAVWKLSRMDWRQIGAQAGVKRTSFSMGLLLSVLFAGVILGIYFLVFRHYLEPGPVKTKVESLGILNYYWFAAIYFSLGNAFLEEYYFRGFLVGRVEKINIGAAGNGAINAAVFSLHHFVVLITMFGPGLTIFLSAGTAAAGFIWGYARARGVSIFDLYMSHVVADLAIFAAGWHLISAA